MVLFRICLAKYATSLRASGRAARWNSNDVEVIYTSSTRALACLENIVHRSQQGLNQEFKILSIEIPQDIVSDTICISTLAENWREYWQMEITQNLGDKWVMNGNSVLLKVPSSIIADEYNYLINPLHVDFKRIKLIRVENFVFDDRIKL
jgi:RES domain-containing protein